MTTARDVVIEARAWCGTPWRHQATIKGVATDCLGLVAGVGLELDLPGAAKWRADTRMRNYARKPDARLMLTVCAEYLDPVSVNDAQIGDILLMQFDDGPQHFGILSCVLPARLIHAFAGAGQVVEHGIDATWRARVVRCYRFRGLAE